MPRIQTARWMPRIQTARWMPWVIGGLLALGLAPPAFLRAQSTTTRSAEAADSPSPASQEREARAADAESAPLRPASVGTSAGPGRYAPGKWGLVKADVINPRSQDAEALISSYLGEDRSLQFGRRIWIPARSRRMTTYPVLVPEVEDRQQQQVAIGTLMHAAAERGAREALLRKTDGHLILDQGRVVTGFISDFAGPISETDWSYEAALAVRTSQQQTRQLAIMNQLSLPATPESIDVLDQLVLSSSKLHQTPASLRAIRTWLFRGGRLWIMLDRVGAATTAELLGDSLDLAVLDRVGLTSVTVQSTSPTPHEKPETLEFEQPVELVRVLVPEDYVAYTVNGWPAAFWVPVGRGRVLITTLGAEGWLRLRLASDPPPRSDLYQSDYLPRAALNQLAGDFLAASAEEVVTSEQAGAYLSERIGYRTLPRPALMAILGGFCLAVVGGAVWFTRRGHPERLAPATAVVAVALSSLIVAVGWSSRSAVPRSVAEFQLVEVLPDPSTAHVAGQLALYNPSTMSDSWGVRRGGILWPDLTGLAGETRRMMFDDLDSYTWENLRLPPGVRLAACRMTVAADGPLLAQGEFDPRGVVGSLRVPELRDPGDALLAGPSGRVIAVDLRPDGTFTVPASAVLDAGQFMADGLLTDEQRRRRAIYAELLDPASPRLPLHGPTLLVWAAARDLPLRLPDNPQRLGAALLAIPLRLRTGEPGSEVLIPAPLLEMRSVVGPQGQSLSSSYNNRNRQWLTQTVPADIHLRFQVPPAALPLIVERAELKVKINCPTRKVEVVGFDERQPRVLATYDGPSRLLSLPIDDPRVLRLDEDGGLLLGIYVDQNVTSENETEWRIDDVQLEVAGRIGPE